MTSKREVKEPVLMKVIVPKVAHTLIKSLAKKLGVRQMDLCGMWLEQLNPNDELLLEKIRHLKAKEEVLRIASTRNALIAKLHGRGMLAEIERLNNDDLKILIGKIEQRKNKRK